MTEESLKNQPTGPQQAYPPCRPSSIKKIDMLLGTLEKEDAHDPTKAVYTGTLEKVVPRAHSLLVKMEKVKMVRRVGSSRRRYFKAGKPYANQFPKGREIEVAIETSVDLLLAHLKRDSPALVTALTASGTVSIDGLTANFNRTDDRGRLRLYGMIIAALVQSGQYNLQNGYPEVLNWQTAPDKWYLPT